MFWPRRYEIHSAVFLYKAHAVGAVRPERHAQLKALMRKFISVFMAAAVDENHIASRYAELLERLWFRRSKSPATGNHGDTECPERETRDAGITNPLGMIGPDVGVGQLLWCDDIGLQPFDYTDNIDALFAMPLVLPSDQTGAFESTL